MRTATRQQVLEAADWCAQQEAWCVAIDEDGSLDMPDRMAYEIACSSHAESWWWAMSSSRLYAAALADGPMPAGWEMSDV